jgi:hypothetical protein
LHDTPCSRRVRQRQQSVLDRSKSWGAVSFALQSVYHLNLNSKAVFVSCCRSLLYLVHQLLGKLFCSTAKDRHNSTLGGQAKRSGIVAERGVETCIKLVTEPHGKKGAVNRVPLKRN